MKNSTIWENLMVGCWASLAITELETMLAVMACLDEYIGVSNTNMHLRAAVGKSGRVLVPHPADYKWMAAGRSPWFPAFKVYRQSVDGGWGTAFASLSSDLARPMADISRLIEGACVTI